MSGHGILAVVLAGGRARRFGGVNKALLQFGEKPMIEYVLDRLSPAISQTIISANADPQDLRRFGLPVVDDGEMRGAGPLAGLLAAMRFAQDAAGDFEAILSVPVDTPFLPRDVLQQLIAGVAQSQANSQGRRAGFAATTHGWHPVTGLWPLDLQPRLGKFLASGQRKAHDWVRYCHAQPVFFDTDDQPIDPFFNVNTPGDLQQAGNFLHAGS